jgi:hypothetical protein
MRYIVKFCREDVEKDLTVLRRTRVKSNSTITYRDVERCEPAFVAQLFHLFGLPQQHAFTRRARSLRSHFNDGKRVQGRTLRRATVAGTPQPGRANARKSTGPRAPHGKARAAGNARRLGKSLSVLADLILSDQVAALARAIAGGE